MSPTLLSVYSLRPPTPCMLGPLVQDPFAAPKYKKKFYNKFVCIGRSPTPHPISLPTHFVCKFSHHGDNLSFLRPGSPSITVLVFPDFADAYSRTTASYRLTQLSGQIPESRQFLGASLLRFGLPLLIFVNTTHHLLVMNFINK
jgi:hypothetical protein